MTSTSWCRRAGLVSAGAFLVLVMMASTAAAGPVSKRDIDGLLDGKLKRPFCNAFTGCGKKRSDPELEGLASGSELDDLAKHVLAEARLWEGLQNKMEAMRLFSSRLDGRPTFRRKRFIDQHQDSYPASSNLNTKEDVEKQ